MAQETRFRSLKEFYPFYLSEHSDSTCRTFHFVGTTLVIGLALPAIVTLNWKLFALIPVAGYGFAWVGHFFFEKNRPAAFGNPFYSLASDFMMYWQFITGQLPRKLEEAKKLYP
jgi:hypothetical protein